MRHLKVLLVDDVQLFLEFERALFERTGCRVLTAKSGQQAVEMARIERPHIVLLDWEMPGMKGDEVCRILKSDPRTKPIPILLLTNFGEGGLKERCLAAGATAFVTKPIAGKELMERVVELLQIPQRVFLRAPLSIEIAGAKKRGRRRAVGQAEDVSETGMLLEVPEPIAAGSELAMEFSLPGHPGPVKVPADVVRTYEKEPRGRFGVGVRFGSLAPAIRQVLRSYVLTEVSQ